MREFVSKSEYNKLKKQREKLQAKIDFLITARNVCEEKKFPYVTFEFKAFDELIKA